MRTVVPLDVTDAKSRLAGVLDTGERRVFAAAACRDVLDAVRGAGGDPLVLADAPLETGADPGDGPSPFAAIDCQVRVDDRPLTAAVQAAVDEALDDSPDDDGGDAVAVVMADLALATPAAVERLYAALDRADVAIAPGLGGGTNAVAVAEPAFTFDYHGASVRDHRAAARAAGVEPATVDSYRLAVDVDEPADLAEVLLHGEGHAADWLREAGFELATGAGRVSAVRE
ncbi:MAG: 2-phospho-L-lactate guanylyltransferase [Halobacteriaceae archaeon]